MRSALSFFFIIAFGLYPIASWAQHVPAKKFDLTIDNIMRGPELVGYEPTNVRWSRDSKKIYFSWKRADEPRNADFSTYSVNADGSDRKKLSEEEARKEAPPFGDMSDDKKMTVYADSGDIFLYNNETGARRQLTKTSDIEANPRFIGDQRQISFTRSNNLYSLSLDDGTLEQLTDFRAAGAAEPPTTAGGRGAGRQTGGDQTRGTESQESLKKEERELL